MLIKFEMETNQQNSIEEAGPATDLPSANDQTLIADASEIESFAS